MNKCISLNSKQEVQDDHRQSSEETNETFRTGEDNGAVIGKVWHGCKECCKYSDLDKLPSELQAEGKRDWRTRSDSFIKEWPIVTAFLEINPGLEAKTLFEHLQRQYPGRFSDGQLRTFQRKIKG